MFFRKNKRENSFKKNEEFTHNLCQEYLKIDDSIEQQISLVPETGENSLTDVLVKELRLLDKRVRHINVTPINQRKEAKNGADIAIWFIYNNMVVPLLIQSKKFIGNEYDCCKSIKYKVSSGRKEFQYKLLIKSALNTNMIPLYMFYTEPFNSNKCENKKNSSIHMLSAEIVASYATVCKNNKLELENLLESSYPFHYMLCNIFSNKELFIEFLKNDGYLKSIVEPIHLNDVFEKIDKSLIKAIKLESAVPTNVKIIYESQYDTNEAISSRKEIFKDIGILSRLLNKFRNNNSYKYFVNNAMVVDFRESDNELNQLTIEDLYRLVNK